jgi:hypothetical protein
MSQTPFEFLTLRDVLIYVALPSGGAIIGHLWTRFRRRMATLRWTAQYQPIAFATQDFGWGKVDILYNDQPVGNLHIITARVINDSQIDLQSVELHFQVDDGTFVLRSMAQLVGALDALPFAPAYAAMLAQASQRKLTGAELAVWGRRSDFLVPVLNRGGNVDARFLVSRSDHATPTIVLACNHLGVKVRHEPPAEQFLGVNQALAAWLGVFVGFGVTVAVVRGNLATWTGAIAAWLAGALSILVGAGVVWVWRLLRRLAG